MSSQTDEELGEYISEPTFKKLLICIFIHHTGLKTGFII